MHKLTEEIWSYENEPVTRSDGDKKITKFLSAVAEKLKYLVSGAYSHGRADGALGLSSFIKVSAYETIDRNLGLTPLGNSPKGPMFCDCHQVKLHLCPKNEEFIESLHKPKETEKMSCDDFKECPECGIFFAHLKIQEKTLTEKFAETSIVKGDASCGMTSLEKGKILAEIATKHFEQKSQR